MVDQHSVAVVVRDLIRVVQRVTAPLQRRVRLMIGRGAVKLVKDGHQCQELQVTLLADEVHDGIERFQDYGFTSVPFADGNAEVLFLSVGGDRSHGIAACVSDRSRRPKDLTEGDVCLFTDKGERVYLNTTDDVVHVGAKDAAEWIAQAGKTKTEFDALRTTVNNLVTFVNSFAHLAHVTTATPSVSTTPGVITPTLIPNAQPHGAVGEVAATKAKVT